MSVTHPDVAASRPAAAERLEVMAPGYLAKVRRAAGRLSVRSQVSGDLEGLLEDVAEQAHIDVEVPTASRRRAVRLLKVAVKHLIGWYLRYLAQQVTVLGDSVSRLGRELAARADTIEARTESVGETVTALVEDVEGLRRRVGRLEAATATGAEPGSAHEAGAGA
jgi:hypothetical protein